MESRVHSTRGSLPVTALPHGSQGPSETLIFPPAKPFSLHWLLPAYMAKSLPSSNLQTNKSSVDLMPCLSSVLLSQTPKLCPHYLHLLTEKTYSRPRSFLPGHTAGLQLAASPAFNCGHMHRFWLLRCERKRASHLLSYFPSLQCELA